MTSRRISSVTGADASRRPAAPGCRSPSPTRTRNQGTGTSAVSHDVLLSVDQHRCSMRATRSSARAAVPRAFARRERHRHDTVLTVPPERLPRARYYIIAKADGPGTRQRVERDQQHARRRSSASVPTSPSRRSRRRRTAGAGTTDRSSPKRRRTRGRPAPRSSTRFYLSVQLLARCGRRAARGAQRRRSSRRGARRPRPRPSRFPPTRRAVVLHHRRRR